MTTMAKARKEAYAYFWEVLGKAIDEALEEIHSVIEQETGSCSEDIGLAAEKAWNDNFNLRTVEFATHEVFNAAFKAAWKISVKMVKETSNQEEPR